MFYGDAQALDAVSSGSVECAFTPTGYYAAKDPTLVFGSGVPFGLNVESVSIRRAEIDASVRLAESLRQAGRS